MQPDPTPANPASVQAMFSGIARRYDLLNHLLSFWQDHRWRRRAAALVAAHRPRRVLDLAAGTGDLALAVSRACPQASLTLADFTHAMLALAPPKFAGTATPAAFTTADALAMPFEAGVFDAATIGFGFRNFARRDAGLREVGRVLRPGGLLVVLEFSQPEGPFFSPLYRFYLKRLLPLVGGVLSRSGLNAYAYLARTVGDFPPREAISRELAQAGFTQVRATPLCFGIVAMHQAVTPAEAP